MRDNVVEELRQIQPDNEAKQKMVDILKRFHAEDEADFMDEDASEESTLSEETIEKILSGGEVSIDDLSAEEKKRFQRAVASGELSKMIEPWEPWWLKPSVRTLSLSQEGSQLVQPLVNQQKAAVSSHEDLESNDSTEIPSGPETPLPPLRKLCSQQPSPLVVVNLIDIIYSYCFTLRLYNGDWHMDAEGSAMVLLSVSSVLGSGRQPETVREALCLCLEQTCSPAYKHMGGFQFGLGLIDDLMTLLSHGGSALICSLCDLQRLIQAGGRDLRSEKRDRPKRGGVSNKLKHAERKVFFMMCWVHEQQGEAWSSLADIVRADKASAVDFRGRKSNFREMEQRAEGMDKLLIEEVA